MDGVVADLSAEWLRIYNEEWNDDLIQEQITDWDMSKFVVPECGNKIYEILHRPDLYDNVAPIDGALKGIDEVRSGGHRVVFATSCVNDAMAAAKIRWLQRHGFVAANYKGMQDVIVVQDKGMLRGDLLIDDYGENLRKFQGWKILFDASHNQHESEFNRLSGWSGGILAGV